MVQWLCKFIGAAAVAFLALNLFCLFYYNVPVHAETSGQLRGVTDHVWPANTWYCRATEGFAQGITDENGYNNLWDAGQQELGVLLLGSSHMEAFNVAQQDSAAYLLNTMISKRGGDYYVYNIGMSAHSLLRCARNLDAALDAFCPTKYAVIETSSLTFPAEQIRQVLDGTYPFISSHNGGIVGKLQKMPCMRLWYAQIKALLGKTDQDEGDLNSCMHQNEADRDRNAGEARDALLSFLSETAAGHGVQLIIAYHPSLKLGKDGMAYDPTDPSQAFSFAEDCERYGVVFVDCGKAFIEQYKATGQLPHGFSNTAVGRGHMNRYGHKKFAEEIDRAIQTLEESEKMAEQGGGQ